MTKHQFKKEMKKFGLDGAVRLNHASKEADHLLINIPLSNPPHPTPQMAHVGHVVSRKKGGKDQGWNLMALPLKDNWTLGGKIVPCDMAAYWNGCVGEFRSS